jgi:hypothetical protein
MNFRANPTSTGHEGTNDFVVERPATALLGKDLQQGSSDAQAIHQRHQIYKTGSFRTLSTSGLLPPQNDCVVRCLTDGPHVGPGILLDMVRD